MSKISTGFLTCFVALSAAGVASAADNSLQSAFKAASSSGLVANNLQLNTPKSEVARRADALAGAFSSASAVKSMIGSQDFPVADMKLDVGGATGGQRGTSPFANALSAASVSNMMAGKLGDSTAAESMLMPATLGLQNGSMSNMLGDAPISNLQIGK